MRKPRKIKQLRHFAMGIQGDDRHVRSVTLDFLDDACGEAAFQIPNVGEEFAIGPLLDATIGHVRAMATDMAPGAAKDAKQAAPPRQSHPNDEIGARRIICARLAALW
jgi:hypothetical protein